MPTEVRGSWTIDEGVKRRWDEKSLDDRFREWWPTDPTSADDSHYPVLHDEEARPTPPGPYCVYEKSEGSTQQRHSGKTSITENEILVVPVMFRIHAKSGMFSGGTRSGKDVAKELAKHVAVAFDQSAGPLDIAPDRHVKTLRQSDFDVREGDTEWVWVLRYDIEVDAEYDRFIAT